MICFFRRLTFFILVMGLLLSLGCPFGNKGGSGKTPTAVVSNSVKETALATVTLSEDAVQRLGIKVAPVVEKTVQRTRVFGGEIMVPPGQSVMVAAPWSGTLSVGNSAKSLSPGMAVQQGETIFMIQPVVSAEQGIQLAQLQIEARQRVEAAQIEWDATNLELNRAKQLLQDRAGSQQAVDVAEAKVKLAQQALESAKTTLKLLENDKGNFASVSLTPEPIVAPVSGILNHFTSIAGQTVVQGSILFDIVNTGQFWVRVPVYVGQLRNVNLEDAAVVSEFSQTDSSAGVIAKPVTAPPSANPNAATVDLYYALQTSEPWIRPGHKVTVRLPISGNETRLTVPESALVIDIHGGFWVYKEIEARTYSRQRVEVEYSVETADGGREAVLRRGPVAGTPIVITGAAEIFGTEFGGK